MEKENNFRKPKATDGFSKTEKLKAVIPGTAEHRAKKAAKKRLDGQLPHSTIQQVDQMDQNKMEGDLPMDQRNDNLSMDSDRRDDNLNTDNNLPTGDLSTDRYTNNRMDENLSMNRDNNNLARNNWSVDNRNDNFSRNRDNDISKPIDTVDSNLSSVSSDNNWSTDRRDDNLSMNRDNDFSKPSEKFKVIPGTNVDNNSIDKNLSVDRDNNLYRTDKWSTDGRKPTDGFSTGEKLKSVVPGTQEHRIKKQNKKKLKAQKLDREPVTLVNDREPVTLVNDRVPVTRVTKVVEPITQVQQLTPDLELRSKVE